MPRGVARGAWRALGSQCRSVRMGRPSSEPRPTKTGTVSVEPSHSLWKLPPPKLRTRRATQLGAAGQRVFAAHDVAACGGADAFARSAAGAGGAQRREHIDDAEL
eukprot:3015718-Prymnesium_polylepis.1